METRTDIRRDIRRADDDFEAAFARGDSKGLANLYTEDGMLLPAGTDFISGKEKIAGFWQAVMDMGIKRAKLEIIETEQHGDTAIEMSRYRLSGADGELMDEGKYIVVWKQVDGSWKLHRDIWTSSVPPQG